MFKKWEQTLKTYGNAGVDVRNPERQKEILAGIIGDYARLTKAQINQLHSAIQSADLNNNNQVKAIMNQAVSNTLANRGVPLDMLEPKQEPETAPATSSAPAKSIASGTRARAQGQVYVWTGTNWRNMSNGRAAAPNVADMLTKQVP